MDEEHGCPVEAGGEAARGVQLNVAYLVQRLEAALRAEREMEALREMILAEDRLFLDAFRAVNSCPQVHLAGEMYNRPKFPDAKPEYQDWLNRKEIGVDYTNSEDFAPVLDGTFVPFMLKTMRQLAPLYRLLLAAKERADAAGREALQ